MGPVTQSPVPRASRMDHRFRIAHGQGNPSPEGSGQSKPLTGAGREAVHGPGRLSVRGSRQVRAPAHDNGTGLYVSPFSLLKACWIPPPGRVRPFLRVDGAFADFQGAHPMPVPRSPFPMPRHGHGHGPLIHPQGGCRWGRGSSGSAGAGRRGRGGGGGEVTRA
jgi:hypothetical protein